MPNSATAAVSGCPTPTTRTTRAVPCGRIDVLVDDREAERAEVAAVKVAMHEVPVTRLGQEVKFVGLTALPYVASGTNRVALSFSEGMEGAGQVPRGAEKPAA
jgi:hypothetical protein